MSQCLSFPQRLSLSRYKSMTASCSIRSCFPMPLFLSSLSVAVVTVMPGQEVCPRSLPVENLPGRLLFKTNLQPHSHAHTHTGEINKPVTGCCGVFFVSQRNWQHCRVKCTDGIFLTCTDGFDQSVQHTCIEFSNYLTHSSGENKHVAISVCKPRRALVALLFEWVD